MPSQISIKSLSVLLVDDDVELLEVMVYQFKKSGATVQGAKSGNDALEKLKLRNFDIVITDINMPDGDGYYLANRIQQLPGRHPLIFFYSGHVQIPHEDLAHFGIQAVFKKPTKFLDMVAEIEARASLYITET